MRVALILFAFAVAFEGYAQIDSVKSKSLEYQRLAWKEYQAQRFEKAVELLDSSIALDSSRPSPYILKSEALWFRDRFAEAAATYEKWIGLKVATDSSILLVGAYVHLGMLYDKANLLVLARNAYGKAICTYESGVYKPHKTFKREEELEYVMAFGLLGDDANWKLKLEAFVKKYGLWDLQNLKDISRDELLKKRFAPYMLNGG